MEGSVGVCVWRVIMENKRPVVQSEARGLKCERRFSVWLGILKEPIQQKLTRGSHSLHCHPPPPPTPGGGGGLLYQPSVVHCLGEIWEKSGDCGLQIRVTGNYVGIEKVED